MRMTYIFFSCALLLCSGLIALQPTSKQLEEHTTKQATRSWLTKKKVALGGAAALGLVLWYLKSATAGKTYQLPQKPEDEFAHVLTLDFSRLDRGARVANDHLTSVINLCGPLDNIDNCIIGIVRQARNFFHITAYVKRHGQLTSHCYTLSQDQSTLRVTNPPTCNAEAHFVETRALYSLKDCSSNGPLQLPDSYRGRHETCISLDSNAYISVSSPLIMHICRGRKEQ